MNSNRSISRQLNEQAILDQLLTAGPVSRAALATTLGLSKPTVNAIVRDLEDMGMLRPTGQTQGSVGRSATLYGLNDQVGWVLAADVGGTKISFALSNMLGEIVAEATQATDGTSMQALLDQVVGVGGELTASRGLALADVRVACLGMPGIVDPETRMISHAPNLPLGDSPDFIARLARAMPGASVQAFNDVNLAAVGERWRGLAQRRESFAFLSIGTGVGMGLVINGELCEGFGGQAGEVGWLPIGGNPFDPSNLEHGTLEECVSGSAITRRLMDALKKGVPTCLDPDSRPSDVFDAAEAGDSLAVGIAEEVARAVTLAVAAIAAVSGPELVVLGGGVGSHEWLASRTRKLLPQVTPLTPLVEVSSLGQRAALWGALSMALRQGRERMLSWSA
ncbi:MAG: ROK family protein [Candidatus Nanopelagicales bacterium]